LTDKTKPSRGEVKLDPSLQARLLQQMKEEQAAAMRGQALRRYVALPLFIGATAVSAVMMLYGDTVASVFGNVLFSILIVFLWVVRKRIGSVFGF
jgi:uncharacterized membrane protein